MMTMMIMVVMMRMTMIDSIDADDDDLLVDEPGSCSSQSCVSKLLTPQHIIQSS